MSTETAEPTFDAHGYPTEETLGEIERWDIRDAKGWFAFCKAAWHLADWGWAEYPEEIAISTGGWSGNESIIDAMMNNHALWGVHWRESRRGGQYKFELPKW